MTATAVAARVDASGLTDVGLKRKVNEDHFVIAAASSSSITGGPTGASRRTTASTTSTASYRQSEDQRRPRRAETSKISTVCFCCLA